MLKWTLSPRINGEFFESLTTENKNENLDLITLEKLVEKHSFPCLVRLVNEDFQDSHDNYCLLLCQTRESYLVASNENERFSIPLSFDGLFTTVERGITCYNVLQSVQALQNYLKTTNSSNSSENLCFTSLTPCSAQGNSSIRPGELYEICSTSNFTSISHPSTSSRFLSIFSNLPHSFYKYRTSTNSNEFVEIRSVETRQNLTLRNDSKGIFVPVQTKFSSFESRRRSSNPIQSLFTVEILSQMNKNYPFITELVVSQTIEEDVPKTVGYPCRLMTIHRLVEDHKRLIAFDMKNYAFVEIDASNNLDNYIVEQNDALFQRYQAQLRWCEKHLKDFRSQIKTIVHLPTGTTTLVQSTPFHGQQLQPHHQRRSSSSAIVSPLVQNVPKTIFTSQESISFSRSKFHKEKSKFHTVTNMSDENRKQKQNLPSRKDVRLFFNDSTIKTNSSNKSMIKQTSFHQKKKPNHRINPSENLNAAGDEQFFECTSL